MHLTWLFNCPSSPADEPLPAWRCPICRTTVDPAGVVPAAELPPESRGRQFFRPDSSPPLPQKEQQQQAAGAAAAAFDVEAAAITGCGCSGQHSGSGSSISSGSKQSPNAGRLVGVNNFMSAARRALFEERWQEQPGNTPLPRRGTSGSGGSGGGGGGCSMLALQTAERLLPAAAVHAAATALASLRLRQLLNPKREGSLALAAAVWLYAAAGLAAGAAAGVALLSFFLQLGLLALCRINSATAALFGLRSECPGAAAGPPLWMVGLICLCGVSAVYEIAKARHAGRMWPFFLRLDHFWVRMVLCFYAAIFLIAFNILLLAWAFHFVAIVGAVLTQPGAAPEPPGGGASWQHLTAAAYP